MSCGDAVAAPDIQDTHSVMDERRDRFDLEILKRHVLGAGRDTKICAAIPEVSNLILVNLIVSHRRLNYLRLILSTLAGIHNHQPGVSLEDSFSDATVRI